MQSNIKTDGQLQQFYETLQGKYEGYIQMSDSLIEHIFQSASNLPSWSDLHNGINYILEMALFEPNTQKSILVRQVNNKWLVIEKDLTDEEINGADIFYTLTKNLKAKIAQIWQEEEDEFCLGLKILTPKTLLFAGFKTGGEK